MTGPTRGTIASHAVAAVGMSLPWPLLVLLVWERAGDGWALGLAGAARMLPYVALSWAAGRLADRFARDRIVRLTLAARLVLLVGVAAALTIGQTWLALVAATLAIAAATPAYPALAAAMPGLAGRHSERATGLLVTCEVASFVVGPALGGLMLAPATRPLVPWVAVVCLVAAWVLFDGVRLPKPAEAVATTRANGVLAALRTSGVLRGAVAAVAVVNAVAAAVGLALLPLAEAWDVASEGTAFGIATGALGLGALGGPVLGRIAARWRLGPRVWLVVLGGCLVGVVPAPSLWVAVPLLTVAGAAAVQVEIVATAYVQSGRTGPSARQRPRADRHRDGGRGPAGRARLAGAGCDHRRGAVVMLLAAAGSVAAVALVRRPESVQTHVGEDAETATPPTLVTR